MPSDRDSDRDYRSVSVGAVLYGDRGDGLRHKPGDGRDLWHVVDVLESRKNGDVFFRLEDGTHTHELWYRGEDLLWDFNPAGWTCPTARKPLYHLTRQCGVDDDADLMTDGGRENFPTELGSVHTHGTAVAVANDAMVFFEDDDKYHSDQVVFLDGGFVKLEYEGDTHILPRERITAVIAGGSSD